VFGAKFNADEVIGRANALLGRLEARLEDADWLVGSQAHNRRRRDLQLCRACAGGQCRSFRLCEEVHVNLAYRWFCRLGLEADVPNHSTFSKNPHGRFRDSDTLRQLFETTAARCIDEKLVGGVASQSMPA